MTFRELVNAVLHGGAPEWDRDLVKQWVNDRYGMVWDLEEWSFRQGNDAVTVTAGSTAVSGVASDVGLPLAMFRANGDPLELIPEYRDFAGRYLGTDNTTQGVPEAFCAVNGTVVVGPTSSETSSAYLLVYEKALTLLSADTDQPAIPAHYHMATIVGPAKADAVRSADPKLAAAYDLAYSRAVDAMRRTYLVSARGASVQIPAFRPGGW